MRTISFNQSLIIYYSILVLVIVILIPSIFLASLIGFVFASILLASDVGGYYLAFTRGWIDE